MTPVIRRNIWLVPLALLVAVIAVAQETPRNILGNPDFDTAGNPNNEIRVAIPDTTDQTVVQIRLRSERIRELIAKGSFTDVYVPAFEAKALALALDGRLAQLPVKTRHPAEHAVTQLVRTAWLLDAFGDLGNRQQILAAEGEFDDAVSRLESLLGTGK